jgi:SAM-dependent methyltransferase
VSSDLTFTGERFLPECSGEIAYEHWHRYAFARRFAAGRRVLDAACGEGYGTALLGAAAASAVGVDIDAATVAHAKRLYGNDRVRFVEGSVATMPLPDASFDLVVSFETIEHLPAADQPRMLAEFARVLAPDGLLVVSSPNKRLYSDARNYVNEFHAHELYRDELAHLLAAHFPAQCWLHQRLACWSGIWTDGDGAVGVEAWLGDAADVVPYALPEAMYFLVVAARTPTALPEIDTRVSLLTDAGDSVLQRTEENAREILRLDGLLKERDRSLAQQTGHIQHLETLVAERERIVAERDRQLAEVNAAREERERIIAERDRQLAELNAAREQRERMIAELERRAERLATLEKKASGLEAERARQDAALAAQERAIAYLQSFRGWLGWPSRRLRQWLRQAR